MIFVTDYYYLVLVCNLLKCCFCSEDSLVCKGVDNESEGQHQGADSEEPSSNEPKLKQSIYGEEALRISPAEPYCLRRPIRRGHLNISQHYPMQQVQIDFIQFSKR